jgi:DNA-binding beta-propeller fold protein YncE
MRRCFPIVFSVLASLSAQMPDNPVRAVTDPGVVTTRQATTPAGVQSVFSGRVQGVAFGENSSEIWVLNAGNIFRLDWRANRVIAKASTGGTGGQQGIRWDGASRSAIVSAVASRKVRLMQMSGGQATVMMDEIGRNVAGAVAIAARQPIAVLPLTGDNQAAVIDLASHTVRFKVETGIAPFGAAVNSAGSVAYVSNWGGRRAKEGDATAMTGYHADRDRVVVDSRGIASTGSVTRIDLRTGRATHSIATGLHPTALEWDEPRGRLYVANGNEDSITIIDTERNMELGAIRLQPFREKTAGIAPTALTISQDGATLYAACGGINAIAVVNVGRREISGLIPTGWYPSGVALSADGKYLAVSTLLGPGSGYRDDPKRRFVHAVRGSVAVVEIPDAAQLAAYTTAVAENNRMMVGSGPAVAAQSGAGAAKSAAAVPVRPSDPSLIEHVVFIIKENRTYDQVMGDMGKGNGDPDLVMFGESVTPNQHRLADKYVLLDNFYATGGNSADGHQWLTQANEVDYCMWPGYTNRSYPFDGSDPIAYSGSGFLWDAALRINKTVRIYGEYAGIAGREEKLDRAALLESWKNGEDLTTRWNTVAPIASLNAMLARNYPAYTTLIPDVVRARIFLADLKKWEAAGQMPNLTLIQLPSNHTNGTSPGSSTPKAMVADNDLALGQIVEGLTHTQFWRTMAIFVVEDDAQNGVDHVDGHRTVALVVSPYARRNTVDSTFYSHPSILKTIELMLGLPTLSLFDRIANDMRASFTDTADYSAYQAVMPKQSLFDANPAAKALHGTARRDALASAGMRWDVPDAVPGEKLNRILWRNIRGGKTHYPALQRSVFSPLSLDIDDDDRD